MTEALFYATHSHDPFFNMAMDEWMFTRVLDNQSLVLLRLYSWNIGAITIGHNQNERTAINSELLDNTPVVRRITGGRALFHEPSELTYSIAANLENQNTNKLAGSLFDSGRNIASGLTEFLMRIGISAQYVRQSSAGFRAKNALHTHHCFESTARHELITGERKIVASAQRRLGSAFLQHGSIKITPASSHPALSSINPKSLPDTMITPITKPDFIDYAAKFQLALSDLLEVNFLQCDLAENENALIGEFADFLKLHPLEKRDLIKQFECRVSLYDKAVN